MLLPLSECAELAGISRSGLMKAIKRGRLTATKDTATGQWAIDSAELSRVYTLKSPGDTALPPNDTQSDVLAEQLRSAESMIDALKNERDYLRRRIDADSESIRTLSAHPNIVAVKDAKGDFYEVSRVLNTTDLIYFSGDDGNVLPHMSIGASGMIGVSANIAPQPPH